MDDLRRSSLPYISIAYLRDRCECLHHLHRAILSWPQSFSHCLDQLPPSVISRLSSAQSDIQYLHYSIR